MPTTTSEVRTFIISILQIREPRYSRLTAIVMNQDNTAGQGGPWAWRPAPRASAPQAAAVERLGAERRGPSPAPAAGPPGSSLLTWLLGGAERRAGTPAHRDFHWLLLSPSRLWERTGMEHGQPCSPYKVPPGPHAARTGEERAQPGTGLQLPGAEPAVGRGPGGDLCGVRCV